MSEVPKPIVQLQLHEGSLLYSDDHMTERPVVGFLSIAVLQPSLEQAVSGSMPVQIRFRGGLTNIIEGVAMWMIQNPGTREAVEGMVSLYRQRQPRGL